MRTEREPEQERPASDATTPTRSACVSRGPPTASTAMPPAEAAWTSESGASASATTYSTQPPMPAKNPIAQRPLRKSSASEWNGRRSVSGGSADADAC